MIVNLINYETVWQCTIKTYPRFLSLRTIRCRSDVCPFKMQCAILSRIVHQDDQENHDIDDIDRYLCHYSTKGEHSKRPEIEYLHHDIAKMIAGIHQNHSDVRGNLRPDHLFPDIKSLNKGIFMLRQGASNNMIFGNHRVPELQLIFNNFMLTDKEKTVKV